MKQRIESIHAKLKKIQEMRYYHIAFCSLYGAFATPLLLNVYKHVKFQEIQLQLIVPFVLAIICIIEGVHHMNKESRFLMYCCKNS